jgi:hypothetical protein
MEPVEFSPQSPSVTNIEQSEAARAEDTDIKLGTPATSAKAVTFDNRIVDFLDIMTSEDSYVSQVAAQIAAFMTVRIFAATPDGFALPLPEWSIAAALASFVTVKPHCKRHRTTVPVLVSLGI